MSIQMTIAYHAPTNFDNRWLDGIRSEVDADRLLQRLGAAQTPYGIVSKQFGSLFALTDYFEAEKFELIEVVGQPALFSDSRISDTSPDFQCDQTGGFPTSLCVNWDKGKAWLQLNDNVNADGVDAAKYEQLCAEYGIRDCPDIERFNQILSSLGDDARLAASLPEDGENYTFTM